MTVLALTARSESGKDFLTNYNINELGYTRVSFNDQIKKLANQLYPWCDLDYPSKLKNIPIQHDANVLGLSPREIWRSLDVLCNTDPLLYINTAIVEAKRIISNGGDVIFPEIRKDVEMEAVRSLGATVIKITAPVMTDRTDENIIDEFEVDYTFKNIKGIGYAEWIKFLQSINVIDTTWGAVLPSMFRTQYKYNEINHPLWNTTIEDRVPSDREWRNSMVVEEYRTIDGLVELVKSAMSYVMTYHIVDLDSIVKEASHVAFMMDKSGYICDCEVSLLVGLTERINMIPNNWYDGYDTVMYTTNLCKYISIVCSGLGISIEEFNTRYQNNLESSASVDTNKWKIELNTK